MVAILFVDGSAVLVVAVVLPVVCYIASAIVVVIAVSFVILFIFAIVVPWKTPFPFLF